MQYGGIISGKTLRGKSCARAEPIEQEMDQNKIMDTGRTKRVKEQQDLLPRIETGCDRIVNQTPESVPVLPAKLPVSTPSRCSMVT